MQLVDELALLVAFPTVSNRPNAELAAHLATRYERLGFAVERFDDPVEAGKCSVIASIGPPGTDGLVLSGHMDVVPTEGQPWSSDPFRLTERDGRLFGRGSADMKGFLAVALQALGRIRPSEYRRELVLVWTHDEEVGCKGSAALVDALLGRSAARPLPRACLIGEPTSLRILRMHPGHATVQVDVRGRAAHSSIPDLGLNAIEAAARIVGAVAELAEALRRSPARDLPQLERPWVAVNVGRIEGGSAVNIVPDRCRLEIGYRPLPGTDTAEVFEALRARVAALGLRAEVTLTPLASTPSLLTPEGTPLQRLLEAHADAPGCGAAPFATDGGNLARLGLQPLVFGPGSIEVAHRADEHVAIRELVRAVDGLEAIVRARCC